ncbi:MAG: GAF domain-containing protein [Gemmatimonadaceae bacterium]|nr:GAF domain-containing protein [Acetobacteraceae bacterium]
MDRAVTWEAGTETDRLQSLRDLNVLDTPREIPFDRIVFIVAQAFRVPVAAVGLMDVDRQWFKAQVGITAPEIPRATSLCNYVVKSTAPIIVEDLMADERFRGHTQVTEPNRFRFYAGAPLRGPGDACVGSLCVLDRAPRRPTASQIATLMMLANEATALLMARVVDQGKAPNWLGYSAIR